MSEEQALAGFLDKWHARWPEWGVVEVFVPPLQRDVCVAWFALQQELTDSAWAGADPRPGEAKLAWWVEELDGWSQGRRRHPLGLALQRLPAPWRSVASSLPALLASRDPASDWEHAAQAMEPFAQQAGAVSDHLFAARETSSVAGVVANLLAQQLLLCGDSAAPLRIRARLGDDAPGHAAARAWAQDLAQRWPDTQSGSPPIRILATLVHMRLRRLGAGAALAQPLPRMAALWAGWRAARG